MTRELRIALAVGVGALVLAAALYASLFTLGVLPRLGFAPGFALTDASGARLTSEDLRGHVVLYTFATSREEAPARDTAPVMRAVQDALATEDTGEVPVRLVTVVLDAPPEALPDVAAAAGADSARWHVATAAPEPLRTAVRDGFGVWYEEREGRLAYDPTFVIADGMGIVRARYRVGLPPPDALLADLRSVVREAQAARGGARLAYEAAHLFQCYPTR